MKRLWVLACAVGLSACPACFQLKLDDGHPFPCDPDAGEDPADGGPRPDGGPAQCNTGWRCGLERRCHPRGEVADYACTDDSWCEGEWTCGSSGRCGPLIPDGLRLDAGEGPVTVRWLSPLLLDHVPDHVSVAPEEPVFSSYNVSAIAFTEKNRFTEVVRSRFGPPGDPITGAYQNVIFTAALPTSDVRDVMVSATLAPAPLLLTDQGVGYLRGDASADGGAVSLVVPPEWRGVRGDRLRVAAGFGSPLFPLALVLGDAGVITQLGWPSDFPPAPGAGAGFGALPVPALVPFGKSDGGLDLRLGGTVSDLTIVSSAPGSSAGPKDTVLATIDDRLYVSERWLRTGADGGYLAEWQVLALTDAGQVTHQPAPFQLWSFAALGQTQGAFEEMKYDTAAVGYRYGDAGVYRPGRLRSVGDRVAIEAFGSDSAEPQLLLAQLSYLPAPQGGDLVPLLVLQMPPCSACPLGYRLSDFRPVGESVMEARCETLTAGPELTVGLQPAVGDFRCASAVVAGGQGALGEHVLPATSLVGHGGWAGGHGQLWVGESLADTRPLFLDRPPQALISEGTDVAAIDHRTFFFSDDQLGFIGANGLPPEPSLVPVSSVLGREDWTLTGGMLLGRRATGGFGDIGGSAVAVQGSSIDLSTVREPYLAAIAWLRLRRLVERRHLLGRRHRHLPRRPRGAGHDGVSHRAGDSRAGALAGRGRRAAARRGAGRLRARLRPGGSGDVRAGGGDPRALGVGARRGARRGGEGARRRPVGSARLRRRHSGVAAGGEEAGRQRQRRGDGGLLHVARAAVGARRHRALPARGAPRWRHRGKLGERAGAGPRRRRGRPARRALLRRERHAVHRHRRGRGAAARMSLPLAWRLG
ncbi:MAG: hypothetical protein IPJ65_34435 [Archangiaceae bacterium]|nr:hypothetical protein [Archangiaceae bacterium]